jgi:predicted ATPase
LLTLGPDLIGTLVPGTALLGRVAVVAAGEIGLKDQLAKHVDKPVGANVDLDKSKIEQQYTSVLTQLAKQQPIVVVLDDLQWTDSASIDLLFHLSREMTESRVLILSTYRPDDVALGRDGERHPLDRVLNEIKRYYGDIVITLEHPREADRRAFIDSLLDHQPNHLGAAFREALLAHTGGHALFTVELLRDMQERGDLIRDREGAWVEGPQLNWDLLPARVEGVIAERIARLPDDLRDILTTASVEGQEFTTQVLAQVHGIPERQLLRTLARDLDKRHRLVEEAGEERLGAHTLTRYRFTHAPVQQYLYNDLSAGERRLLHAEIAPALETLYEGHTDDVAQQLARHYALAGEPEKAIPCLQRVGEQALSISGFIEARKYFERALALATGPTFRPARTALTQRLGTVHLGLSDFGTARRYFTDSLSAAKASSDGAAQAAALSGLGRLATETGAYPEAKTRLEESLALGRTSGDQAGLVVILRNLGMITNWQWQ